MQKAAVALAGASLGLVLACCIVAMGAGSNLHQPTELIAKAMSPRQRTVLHVASQLHGESVPQMMAMKAANAFTTIELMCAGSGTGTHAAAMDRYRKRADEKCALPPASPAEDCSTKLNRSHTRTHANTHTHTYRHTHMLTHARTHTRTSTHTLHGPSIAHTHTHTQTY